MPRRPSPRRRRTRAPSTAALARLRAAVRELSAVIEAAKRLNSTLDLGEVIQIILQIATRQTGADRGTVFLLDRERNEIWSLVGLGLAQREIRIPADRGLAGWVAQHGRKVNLRDAYNDSRFAPEVDRELGYRTRSLLCLPIRNRDGEISGVLQLLNKRGAAAFTSADARILEALSVHVALALENAQLHRELLAKERLERDLELARQIQTGLLPAKPPALAGVEIAVTHRPSQMVGGDYYDFVPFDEQTLLVVVADVEGKGVASALVMANLQAMLHALSAHVRSLERLIETTNRMILTDTHAGKYFSLFAAILDLRHRALHYINAGHVPPALVRADGSSSYLEEGGMVVGLFPDVKYERGTIALREGDVIVACTDGITEANNARSEEYSRERLVGAVAARRQLPAAEILSSVFSEVDAFSRGGSHDDDRVLLIIKCL